MINKDNNECETKLCYESAIRTRFYNGMLLTDQHLREEQQYHREKLKRANRHLFGAGIVCGLKVRSPFPDAGLCVKIEPGVALDCCGNLIEVCKCITLDLSKLCREKYGQSCVETDPRNVEDRLIKKILVLKYVETESDPEPVLTPAADCRSAGEESKCQKSKVREGYSIELREEDQCPCVETKREPEPARKDMSKANLPPESPRLDVSQSMQAKALFRSKSFEDLLEDYLDEHPMPCSPCGCCDNAVGLGHLTIDCVKNTVEVKYTCRSNVLTPRLIRWLISSNEPAIMHALLDEQRPPIEQQPDREPVRDIPSEGPVESKTGTKRSAAAGKKAATTEKPAAEPEPQPAPAPAADDTKK